MFFDQAKIYIRSGNGGDGMLSFRREKHVPYGGPDGGDGGDGGAIIFTASRHLNSLMRFNRQAHFKAEHGTHGGTQKRNGKRGEDLIIEVPIGTVIRDAETGTILADITSEEHKIMALEGGKGGRGNVHFASSVNQAPRIAERGEPGEEKWVTLELKLIADVGIVGVPNAGKSTLLNKLSDANVLSADMLFATLDPTTRKVDMPGGRELLFTDTVGFIQKLPTDIVAAFRATLEEITEADMLLHVVDATHPHAAAQLESVEDTLAELEVDHLPTVVALNKIDRLPDDVNPTKLFDLPYPVIPVSAVSGEGIPELLVAIDAAMVRYLQPLSVLLPYKRGDLLSLMYERGQVDGEEHTADGVIVHGRLPKRLIPYFQPYMDGQQIADE